jgi:hypothetical protein
MEGGLNPWEMNPKAKNTWYIHYFPKIPGCDDGNNY